MKALSGEHLEKEKKREKKKMSVTTSSRVPLRDAREGTQVDYCADFKTRTRGVAAQEQMGRGTGTMH